MSITGLASQNLKAAVPWVAIKHDQNSFVEQDYLPVDVTLGEPSKLVQSETRKILSHWQTRHELKLPIFKFKGVYLRDNTVRRAEYKEKIERRRSKPQVVRKGRHAMSDEEEESADDETSEDTGSEDSLERSRPEVNQRGLDAEKRNRHSNTAAKSLRRPVPTMKKKVTIAGDLSRKRKAQARTDSDAEEETTRKQVSHWKGRGRQSSSTESGTDSDDDSDDYDSESSYQRNATPGPSSRPRNATPGPSSRPRNATPGPSSRPRNATPGPSSRPRNASPGPSSIRMKKPVNNPTEVFGVEALSAPMESQPMKELGPSGQPPAKAEKRIPFLRGLCSLPCYIDLLNKLERYKVCTPWTMKTPADWIFCSRVEAFEASRCLANQTGLRGTMTRSLSQTLFPRTCRTG